ncbi:MAG: hypothetical protein HUK20_06830 [Fibrobacter sp.]|nr:hypothetical protein [Fibrobacter sp.]
MFIKKLMLPMLLASFAGFVACGDGDSPTTPNQNGSEVINPGDPSNPVNPDTPVMPSDPTTPDTPVIPNEPTTPDTSVVVPDPTTPDTPVTPPPSSGVASLASAADATVPASLYGVWKPFHYVNIEDESVYYPKPAEKYGEVFTADYLPAARVIWSAQTGYYADQCDVASSTIKSMTKRGCTVSEGMGYGMLITYFQGDDDAFIRLWNYSRGFRAYHNLSLTPWITYNFRYNEIDNSSATDADLDIATSLILMYYRTQNQAFLSDALTIVNAIWNDEVNKETLLLYSGDTDMWTGANPVYNLSYFSPVALRLFAQVDKNHDWKGVLDNMYAYMQKVQDAGTGVFPDWSDAAGMAAKPDNGSADKTYWTFNKESVRIPWRIAWDYYWNQDERAKAVLTKLNNFISEKASGNPDSKALATNYSWNLSVGADATGSTVSSHWYGAWCLTGIAGNSQWFESCTKTYNAKDMSTSNSSYFPNILQMMFSQLMNGLYVKPF